ncbi:ATP-binding protein [Ciceribacter ferrooxidans]|uniref:histidine kinase n=1 Tax=Ciceribacter ferrooxidans TaxID=2509717 RepID=A0A4Q2SVX8_9HYPH|nr:ATP-binding protein [Ciceribacter ferrooxidans]RYC09992.1 response regulator [Ciceribacter ferrooxidans]
MGYLTSVGSRTLRKVTDTATILQVLSAILLVVLVGLFVDISRHFQLLYDDAREDALWSVVQFDRDLRALAHDVTEVRSGVSAAVRVNEIGVRFDALGQLARTLGEPSIARDAATETLYQSVVSGLADAERILSKLGTDSDAGDHLADLERALSELGRQVEQLPARVHAEQSAAREIGRAAVLDLGRSAAAMLILLLASVIFLVVTLRRQLGAVRQTGRELKVVTRQLTEAYEAADAGNRAKSQFMATMGHEIRTPLNAILGMAELLEYSELPEDALSSVKTIRSSGEALLEVINEILDYAKIEHGKLELEERAVDISALAETTTNIIRGRAAEHGNAVILDIPDALDAHYVRTDPTRLRQVLLNLLSNAVKFTCKGTVTLRVREFYRAGKLMLRFEVEDTGIGIDEAGLEKLFQPFSQVDASISRRYGGTGLGLTICKQIVEKLGGELGMSSTVGVGSIFWFEIAVVAVDRDEVANHAAGQDAAAGLPRKRILLVEDNRVNQQVARRFLERLCQDVTIANDGAEAVRLCENETFDLIFMDMQMPVMDGIEATRRIAAGSPNGTTPIVAMTANASDDDRRRCVEAGMVGFEAKPITMKRLRNVLTRLSEATIDDSAKAEPYDTGLPDLEAVDIPVLAPLPIDGLDGERQSELVEALGEDVFQELIVSFFDDAGSLVLELRQAVREGSPDDVDRVLHTIKGAAINVGLNDIAGKVSALRKTEPELTDVDRLTDELETLRFKLVA